MTSLLGDSHSWRHSNRVQSSTETRSHGLYARGSMPLLPSRCRAWDPKQNICDWEGDTFILDNAVQSQTPLGKKKWRERERERERESAVCVCVCVCVCVRERERERERVKRSHTPRCVLHLC